MITCERFLDDYSSFRDGMLPTWEEVAFRAHTEECPPCARYHRVLSEGIELLQELPEMEVSDDFCARLQHRIWHEELETLRRRRGHSGRTTALVGVAAAAAGMAIGLGLRHVEDAARTLPGVSVERPGIGGYAVQDVHTGGSMASELARVGVRVYELPYHDVVYGQDPTLVASLAEYGGSPVSHAP